LKKSGLQSDMYSVPTERAAFEFICAILL